MEDYSNKEKDRRNSKQLLPSQQRKTTKKIMRVQ